MEVRDINVTSFAFSKAFDDAIEAKVTASQKAEEAKREAEAIAIPAQTLRTNGGEEYLRLQAINRWDGKLPVYLSPGAPMPFVNAAAGVIDEATACRRPRPRRLIMSPLTDAPGSIPNPQNLFRDPPPHRLERVVPEATEDD